MKLKNAMILFFMLVGISWSAASSAFDFRDTDGNVVSSKEIQNKWLVLNYWAAWCDSCREEVPELNSFYKMNKGKDVIFYGVNYDHLTGGSLVSDIKSMGIQFPNLVEDPSATYGLGELEVLPVTFIIDPKGKVVKKIMGRSTSESINDALKDLRKK